MCCSYDFGHLFASDDAIFSCFFSDDVCECAYSRVLALLLEAAL
jgi:hypothetical protein